MERPRCHRVEVSFVGLAVQRLQHCGDERMAYTRETNGGGRAHGMKGSIMFRNNFSVFAYMNSAQ